MAAYEFLASEPTLKVLSSELVRPAQRVTAQAQESQVVFSLLFSPYPTDEQGTVIWTDELIRGQLEYWAGIWDVNARVPGVLGISVSQDVNTAGQLSDVALVVVGSASGKSQAQSSFPPILWLPERFAPNVEKARAQLDAAEVGG